MSEFPINTTWNDDLRSTAVDWSPEAAGRLRLAALEGLFALPRVGMGVGGFLLGNSEGGQIHIADSLEIPCTHFSGPAFALNEEEMKLALELAASVRSTRVVGCYLSKTKGPLVLSEENQALVRELCPEPWQIVILLRPSTVESSRAAIFFRNETGEFRPGGERTIETPEDSVTDASAPPELVSSSHVGPAPNPPTAQPVRAPEPEPAAAVVTVSTISDEAAPPIPTPARAPARVAVPLFATTEPPRSYGWLRWFLAAALLAGLAAFWFTRDLWMPRPSLRLTASDSKGHLSIRWNAEAVRGLGKGVLTIAEGGQTKHFPLTQDLLEGGLTGYDRSTPQVTVMLKAGESQEIITFLDTSAVQKPEVVPPPPAPLPTDAVPARKP